MNLLSVIFILIASISGDAFSSPTTAVELPSGRFIAGNNANGDIIASLVSNETDTGIAYFYPKNSTELEQVIATMRSNGISVFDVRPQIISTPIPTHPYRTDGFDIQNLVAITEFPNVPNLLEIANFLLFLIKDAEVTDDLQKNEITVSIGNFSRYYHGDFVESIRAAKTALTTKYQINWIEIN